MSYSDRCEILEKIKDREWNGDWDKDVENDPETIVLMPDKVDYLAKKLSTKIATSIANRVAIAYYEKLIKKGTLLLGDINGLENYRSVNGGAIITCNHFSAMDNYVLFRAIRKDLGKKRLYKVIREGNFTNFKGIYGFFFRHCNTLPLSSNMQTMKKFIDATKKLLSRGEKILIYPEQAMWWNYKKPRPMKNGAFSIAVKNNVPIIPAFITMHDSDSLDSDGFKLPVHTIHFLSPIYPDKNLTDKENVEKLRKENYLAWKKVYEETYKEELTYNTKGEIKI